MRTVTREKAPATLLALLDHLAPGEAVMMTRKQQPVATLGGQQPPTRTPRRPGSAKGQRRILAEDDEQREGQR